MRQHGAPALAAITFQSLVANGSVAAPKNTSQRMACACVTQTHKELAEPVSSSPRRTSLMTFPRGRSPPSTARPVASPSEAGNAASDVGHDIVGQTVACSTKDPRNGKPGWTEGKDGRKDGSMDGAWLKPRRGSQSNQTSCRQPWLSTQHC